MQFFLKQFFFPLVLLGGIFRFSVGDSFFRRFPSASPHVMQERPTQILSKRTAETFGLADSPVPRPELGDRRV